MTVFNAPGLGSPSHSLTKAVVIHSTTALRKNNSSCNHALMFYKRSGVCIKLFLIVLHYLGRLDSLCERFNIGSRHKFSLEKLKQAV